MLDFGDLEEGMRVLFNDRKTPLEVVDVDDGEAVVEGPNGGRYEIYREGDALLVSREGSRRYSSYCEDLRSVGRWKREGETWMHSKTGAEVYLVKRDNGFWTVRTEGLEDSVDTPMYGYSDREFAEEDAQDFVEDHPEG